MIAKTLSSLRFLGALVALATVVHAGPPLICHPYEIGAAKSLPGATDGHWLGLSSTYDRKNLVPDTLALLTPDAPVLVRMETLRRAALYSTDGLKNWKNDGSGYTAEDRALGLGLLEKLQARTQEKDSAKRALALFDAGFFAETLRQTSMDPGIDGYPLLVQAAQARPTDAEIQFALAIVTAAPKRAPGDHADHLARARAAAKTNPLLAANLATHNTESR